MSATNDHINNNQNTVFNNVNNNRQISRDNVDVNKNSYNSNIKDYLVQRKAEETQNKNKYNLQQQQYKADGAGDKNTSHDEQNRTEQTSPQDNPNQAQDENKVVNNFYYPNKQKQDNDINNNDTNNTNTNERKYIGSNFRDIIRGLYDDVKNSKISQYNLLQEMEKLSKNIEFSQEPTNAITKAEKEQKKVKKIKDYNNMSDDFAVLVSKLFKNSDENGAISITDYQDFLDGPVKNLKKKNE